MSNTKLSQLPQDSSPLSTDFLVGINSTPQDSKYAITDLSNLYNPIKFSVYRNAAYTLATGANVIPFDTKLFDTGSNIDVTTNKGRFTAPVAGFYQFEGAVILGTNSGDHFYAGVQKNGTEAQRFDEVTTSATINYTFGISAFLELAASDYVEFYINTSTGRSLVVGNSAYCWFVGYLVSKN